MLRHAVLLLLALVTSVVAVQNDAQYDSPIRFRLHRNMLQTMLDASLSGFNDLCKNKRVAPVPRTEGLTVVDSLRCQLRTAEVKLDFEEGKGVSLTLKNVTAAGTWTIGLAAEQQSKYEVKIDQITYNYVLEPYTPPENDDRFRYLWRDGNMHNPSASSFVLRDTPWTATIKSGGAELSPENRELLLLLVKNRMIYRFENGFNGLFTLEDYTIPDASFPFMLLQLAAQMSSSLDIQPDWLEGRISLERLAENQLGRPLSERYFERKAELTRPITSFFKQNPDDQDDLTTRGFQWLFDENAINQGLCALAEFNDVHSLRDSLITNGQEEYLEHAHLGIFSESVSEWPQLWGNDTQFDMNLTFDANYIEDLAPGYDNFFNLDGRGAWRFRLNFAAMLLIEDETGEFADPDKPDERFHKVRDVSGSLQFKGKFAVNDLDVEQQLLRVGLTKNLVVLTSMTGPKKLRGKDELQTTRATINAAIEEAVKWNPYTVPTRMVPSKFQKCFGVEFGHDRGAHGAGYIELAVGYQRANKHVNMMRMRRPWALGMQRNCISKKGGNFMVDVAKSLSIDRVYKMLRNAFVARSLDSVLDGIDIYADDNKEQQENDNKKKKEDL